MRLSTRRSPPQKDDRDDFDYLFLLFCLPFLHPFPLSLVEIPTARTFISYRILLSIRFKYRRTPFSNSEEFVVNIFNLFYFAVALSWRNRINFSLGQDYVLILQLSEIEIAGLDLSENNDSFGSTTLQHLQYAIHK